MGDRKPVSTMDTQQLLAYITSASSSHLVSKKEVVLAWEQGRGKQKSSLTNILTGIGGLIVAIGIVIFFQQHWQTLGTNMKILVTLGSSIILYISGILLSRIESMKVVAWAFFLAFALLSPFGIWITFDSLHAQFPFFGYETIISGIMLVWFAASFFLLRMGLFTVFSVIAGSVFYFGITGDFLSRNPAIDLSSAFEYRFLLLGLSYVLLGYGWKLLHPTLTAWMYTAGTAMALGAAMGLGGYAPSANLFWETLFPGIALGTMFVSIPLKSKSVLTVASIYLMGYILKITAEYFSDTLGWPIALIVSGFVLIGIGYGALMVGKRYVTQAHPVE